MWELKDPRPVKLITGILGADDRCLSAAAQAIEGELGRTDLVSDVWPFDQTEYYREQTGENILRQFVSIEELIDPGRLAQIKHQTNRLEQNLAAELKLALPRPVNLDPGIIEPSKLVLASTKNYSHRIYIGENVYAEVTLIFDKGQWRPFDYTYPDYRQQCYFDFFDKVRTRLVEQLRRHDS
ncbi:MAG TPA: DUF4416 family protein [Sedimentisphaerales bacterium]|nr:DUF4416 family protein [Sedimentisphaerales bacterium]